MGWLYLALNARRERMESGGRCVDGWFFWETTHAASTHDLTTHRIQNSTYIHHLVAVDCSPSRLRDGAGLAKACVSISVSAGM
jgi:hypothetical protein